MRAHSSLSSEATKQASRADLLSRLEHLVQLATEVCLYAPNRELPKDFIVSLMLLLMAQLQDARPLLSRAFCQSKVMVCFLFKISTGPAEGVKIWEWSLIDPKQSL